MITCPYSEWDDEAEFIRIYADRCMGGRDSIANVRWLAGMVFDNFDVMSRISRIFYTDGSEEDVTIFYTDAEKSTLLSFETGRRSTRLRAVFDKAKNNPATADKFSAYADYAEYVGLTAPEDAEIVDLSECGLTDGTRFIANRTQRGDYLLYLSADRDYTYSAERDVYDSHASEVRAYLFNMKTGKLEDKFIEVPDETLHEYYDFSDAIDYADAQFITDGFYTDEDMWKTGRDDDIVSVITSDDGAYTAYYSDDDLYIRNNKTEKSTLIFDSTPNADEYTYDADGNIIGDIDIGRYRSASACGFYGHKLWYNIALYEGVAGPYSYDADTGERVEYQSGFSIGFIAGGYAYGETGYISADWYTGRFLLSAPDNIEKLWEADAPNSIRLMENGDLVTVYGAGSGGEVYMDYGNITAEIAIRDAASYEIRQSWTLGGHFQNSLTPYFADGVLCVTTDEFIFVLPYES